MTMISTIKRQYFSSLECTTKPETHQQHEIWMITSKLPNAHSDSRDTFPGYFQRYSISFHTKILRILPNILYTFHTRRQCENTWKIITRTGKHMVHKSHVQVAFHFKVNNGERSYCSLVTWLAVKSNRSPKGVGTI